MRTVILVPRRNDGGHRDQLWEFCKQWWIDNHDPMEIYEGHHNEGPFNRSAAINIAAEKAGDWDVALIIDSDTISDPASIRLAIENAHATGGLTVAHDSRIMLTERATKEILAGNRGNWKRPGMVKKTYKDSVSCAVLVARRTWDLIGGFDERFVGWGFEDTAFHIACETVTDLPIKIIKGDCYHLWHPVGPETSKNSPTYKKNHSLKRRYEALRWQRERLLTLIHQTYPETTEGTIPKILHRTVPEETSDEVEGWWQRFGELHPDWEMKTYREPIDPADWPMTGQLFARCQNGAQKAGLIRLEAVYTFGGIYVDSDVIPHRPFDSLLNCKAFAAWEDEKVVPDAVLGAVAGHPAFMELIGRAREALENNQDAWNSGPGGTTEILPGRDDVLLLPPGAFYPAHYLEKSKLGTNKSKPWVFCEHQWHHSWGSAEQKAGIERNQKGVRSMPRQRPTRGTRAQRAAKPTPEPEKVSVSIPQDFRMTICIPWDESEDGWRQAAFEWCKRYWLNGGFNVVTYGGESRSAMRNRCARQAIAGNANVLFFADADTFVSYESAVAACAEALNYGQLTHAFTTYTRLGSATTKQYQAMENPPIDTLARQGKRQVGHMSGACAIPVSLWEQIGGYDERFTEWGHEDRAFELAADTLGLGTRRLKGSAVHWFHRPAHGKGARPDANDPVSQLIIRYCQAAGRVPERGRTAILAQNHVPKGSQPDPVAMLAVLGEIGGPKAILAPASPSWPPPVLEK